MITTRYRKTMEVSMLSTNDISKMFDVTAVRATSDLDDVKECCDLANRLEVAAIFTNNCFIKQAQDWLTPDNKAIVGGCAGFPSGAETTTMKVAVTKEVISFGVKEIDMVANIGALKSGMYDYYRDDIKAVVDAADGLITKSIIEVCYLTDDEIKRASELAVEAGVHFVKTGTGWGPTPTTVDHIKIIKNTIGNQAQIKAAGGIRNLETLMAMYDEGVTRFGIGIQGIRTILEELESEV